MEERVWRKLAFALLGPALLLFSSYAQAISVEKIEVASHLGEAFFAEVPLKLDTNELVSKVFVDVATPSDYKIFEVYRDPILKVIRADVISDARGARVKLSSRTRIKSPFFNLVLKIRYGRVSHFKKFPVFLDASKSIQDAATKAPQPAVDAIKQPARAVPPKTNLSQSAGQVILPDSAASPAVVKPAATYYEGWARTDRYGPIVRGDTLSTVAGRLRIDDRYTRNQIMLALFEKNSSSFKKKNINLLKADSYLRVPTATEVEQHRKVEATRFFADQEKSWKKLLEQPRFAAEAEAQRTRYTKRISVGEHADGVASAPVAVANTTAGKGAVSTQSKPSIQSVASLSGSAAASAASIASANPTSQPNLRAVGQDESSKILEDLRQQNALIHEQLAAKQESIDALNQKIDSDTATSEAEKARLEKLEILIARLQSELNKSKQQPVPSLAAGMDWVIWLLIALVIILIGIVAVLMRREPAHPAAVVSSAVEGSDAAVLETESDESLESIIKHEVADTEPGETALPISKETATIEGLPVFPDELSDTDTAELEPFDADMEPDPDIDYVAEADVYIRYGMDDEAIQRLDMALRQQPDNVDAHIKKAKLLLGKSDSPGLDESIAAATMTLASVDLDRFKASIEQLDANMETEVAKIEAQQESELNNTVQHVMPLDKSSTVAPDFDFSDLNVADSEDDKEQKEQNKADDADDDEVMSWLHDAESEGNLTEELAEEKSGAAQQPVDTEAGISQPLDDLPYERMDVATTQDAKDKSDRTNVLEATSAEILPELDVGGATQELDSLLAEFSDDDEDQLVIGNEEDELDTSFSESVTPDPQQPTDAIIGTNTDHGATQDLDQFIDEFSEDNEDGKKS